MKTLYLCDRVLVTDTVDAQERANVLFYNAAFPPFNQGIRHDKFTIVQMKRLYL